MEKPLKFDLFMRWLISFFFRHIHIEVYRKKISVIFTHQQPWLTRSPDKVTSSAYGALCLDGKEQKNIKHVLLKTSFHHFISL